MKARSHSKAKEEYLLTTKLFCGKCKEMMVGYGGTNRVGKVYHYYACKNRIKKNRTCNKDYIGKQVIEDLVVKTCKELLTDEMIIEIAKGVSEALEKGNDYTNQKRL